MKPFGNLEHGAAVDVARNRMSNEVGYMARLVRADTFAVIQHVRCHS
jgi:hypothetical protein